MINLHMMEIIFLHFGLNSIFSIHLLNKMEGFLSPIHREELQGNNSQLSTNDLIWIGGWLLVEHLWSHVLWATTVSCSKLISFKSLFAETKISYFKVTIHVNHNVFRFDISIDDMLIMKILNSKKNFNETISSLILCHSFHLSQIKEEFTSWTVFISKTIHSRARATKCFVSNAN